MAQKPEAGAERADADERPRAARGYRLALSALLLAITLTGCATPSQTPAVLRPIATAAPSVEATEVPLLVEATPPPEPAAPATPEPPSAVVHAPAPAVATPRPAARPPAAQAVRVRIPALSVDAPVFQMGIDTSGVMEVPQNPNTVAWYGFSAAPGSPGNAVMAAHVTWGGARAVFNQLSALRPGDVIDVRAGDDDLRYVVQRAYLVRPEQADIPAIVGPREGPQTLTLITCGGSFDSSVREYDHRVIVFATRA